MTGPVSLSPHAPRTSPESLQPQSPTDNPNEARPTLSLQNSNLDANHPLSTTEVKNETPAAEMPTLPSDYDADPASKALMETILNEHGTRQRRGAPATSSVAAASPSEKEATPKTETEANPKTTATSFSRKRAAPKSSSKLSRSKTPAKKRRIGTVESAGSPTPSHASVTPTAATNASKKSSGNKSHAASSSPVPNNTDEDSVNSEDENLYCICRKRDNHTWMIGCDGDCNDWFHGKCVGIAEEDEGLIDKYYCPNCEKDGQGFTTWKPVCRVQDCRKPARFRTKGEASKYCSDECGELFMVGLTNKLTPSGERSNNPVKGSHPNQKPGARSIAGPLSVSQLKSIVDHAASFERLRSLGQRAFPSPPSTPNPDKQSDEHDGAAPLSPAKYPVSHERASLDDIVRTKQRLRHQHAVQRDRERFVFLMKEQQSRLEKGQCGYDPRLAWDDETFWEWRNSETGKAAFERGSLAEATDDEHKSDETPENTKNKNDEKPDVCLRKRCGRHGNWSKTFLTESRFESTALLEDLAKIARAEKAIKERASEGVKGDVVEEDTENTVEKLD